jgi:hypothetical protein
MHTSLLRGNVILCRYGISDDEAAADAEGQLARQSEGADLEQLLAESEQFYAQAHFRYRSFLDTVDTEPPPVDVAALEQVRHFSTPRGCGGGAVADLADVASMHSVVHCTQLRGRC